MPTETASKPHRTRPADGAGMDVGREGTTTPPGPPSSHTFITPPTGFSIFGFLVLGCVLSEVYGFYGVDSRNACVLGCGWLVRLIFGGCGCFGGWVFEISGFALVVGVVVLFNLVLLDCRGFGLSAVFSVGYFLKHE